MEEDTVYATSFRVEAEHIDRFGHVKEILFEHANEDFMVQALGVDFEEIENRWGLHHLLAIKDLQYFGTVRPGDYVRITSAIPEISGASFVLSQEMKKHEETIATFERIVTFIDAEGKVVSIPDDLREHLMRS